MKDNLFSTDWLKDFESRIEAAFFSSTVTAEPLPAWRAAAAKYVKKKNPTVTCLCAVITIRSRGSTIQQRITKPQFSTYIGSQKIAVQL